MSDEPEDARGPFRNHRMAYRFELTRAQYRSLSEATSEELFRAGREAGPKLTTADRMSPDGVFFLRFANFLDLALEPDSAESAIANLDELYCRRVATNRGHAKRWLLAQVIWIVFGRVIELLAKYSAARAGK